MGHQLLVGNINIESEQVLTDRIFLSFLQEALHIFQHSSMKIQVGKSIAMILKSIIKVAKQLMERELD